MHSVHSCSRNEKLLVIKQLHISNWAYLPVAPPTLHQSSSVNHQNNKYIYNYNIFQFASSIHFGRIDFVSWASEMCSSGWLSTDWLIFYQIAWNGGTKSCCAACCARRTSKLFQLIFRKKNSCRPIDVFTHNYLKVFLWLYFFLIFLLFS